jgi:hypothetical protein
MRAIDRTISQNRVLQNVVPVRDILHLSQIVSALRFLIAYTSLMRYHTKQPFL